MFWKVVSNMNNKQRQQLLYFATGSAGLPANSEAESGIGTHTHTLYVHAHMHALIKHGNAPTNTHAHYTQKQMNTHTQIFTANHLIGLTISVDVIGSGNTESLPVASTCGQRMSIPLYPTYHMLKKKLLQAIQCQAYGLS